ncbi:MAG: hypothetical protein ABFQ53_03285 [Patescibacteria group bacterium]
MADILESLFGTKSRSQMIRFFVLNPGDEVSMQDLKKRMGADGRRIRADLNALLRIELITQTSRKREKFYKLNDTFPYYMELQTLFLKANTYPQCKELKKVNEAGRVKLVIISGVFLNYDKARLDVLIVCDEMKRAKLLKAIEAIEAEVGREVRYMTMSGDELRYRLDMMDRFLLDVLSAPHEIVVNKVPKLQKFILNLKK